MNTWTCPNCSNVNPSSAVRCLKCSESGLPKDEQEALKCRNEAVKIASYSTQWTEEEFKSDEPYRRYITTIYNLARKPLLDQIEEANKNRIPKVGDLVWSKQLGRPKEEAIPCRVETVWKTGFMTDRWRSERAFSDVNKTWFWEKP